MAPTACGRRERDLHGGGGRAVSGDHLYIYMILSSG